MLKPEYDVVAVGNAMVDIFAHVTEDFILRRAEENGTKKGAMNLIDSELAVDIHARMKDPVTKPGGAACNMAAGFRSFGGKCAFIGKTGKDAFGDVFAKSLREAGIHYATKPYEGATNTATGRSLILITPDGARTMNTFLGATRTLAEADIDAELVASARFLYLEGYLFDSPLSKKAVALAADVARSAGRKVALNLSDPHLVERHRDDFLEMVRGQVDILFANENDAKALFKSRTAAEAVTAAKEHCEIAVITRSAKGSVIASGETLVELPGREVKVVDVTGAGDAFAAGFLNGLTRNASLAACGRLGTAAAADVITHVGGQPQKSYATLVMRELIGTLAKA